MMYYSFVYSHLIYGIIAWDTAHRNKLHEIELKVNDTVRIITRSRKFSQVTNFYKKLNFLKLSDIYKLEHSKFMHKLLHNKLPSILKTKFIKVVNIHYHETKIRNQLNYFLLRVNTSVCQHKLDCREVKLWNEIKDELKTISLYLFKKQFKKLLLNNYAPN